MFYMNALGFIPNFFFIQFTNMHHYLLNKINRNYKNVLNYCLDIKAESVNHGETHKIFYSLQLYHWNL